MKHSTMKAAADYLQEVIAEQEQWIRDTHGDNELEGERVKARMGVDLLYRVADLLDAIRNA